MGQTALSEQIDFYRIDADRKLDEHSRSSLGQYMTPSNICSYMASMFQACKSEEVSILDPGAGVGSLSVGLVEELIKKSVSLRKINLEAFEIDKLLVKYLENSLETVQKFADDNNVELNYEANSYDFIEECNKRVLGMLTKETFTHVIMNPPYKKIHSKSLHRKILEGLNLHAPNLYAAFIALAIKLLRPNGELVAIVPRSFCNGPYFREFRKLLLSELSLEKIHIFDSRANAFKANKVLQENIIFHAIKKKQSAEVTITSSSQASFIKDKETKEIFADDMTRRKVSFEKIVRPNDPEKFIHISSSDLDQVVVDRLSVFKTSLTELGLSVSTGPVVDFRLKDDLLKDVDDKSVPLLYPVHFKNYSLAWPQESKKPNAIKVSDLSRKWLWKNKGTYIATRRFSSKEEKKRLVAFAYDANLPYEFIGFENHLNVFHVQNEGFDKDLAHGLLAYLNSSLLDQYFRQFNGHTQVNSTDLRALNYPSRNILKRIGKKVDISIIDQTIIDNLIDEEIKKMGVNNMPNPLSGQNKVEEALKILKAFDLPRAQQNERSALTLLALVNLTPEKNWPESEKPLIGITPIMDFCKDVYGKNYAPNTRETFRRQTMHQFVAAGIAAYNPDKPDRPVNSPKACYQITKEALETIESYATPNWNKALTKFLKMQKTLARQYAKEREMEMVPVVVGNGQELKLTPGSHSQLIKQIIEEFGPRFSPGGEVIYIGDTGEKSGFFLEEKLAEMGVKVDQHGKMPDVVIYFPKKDWLLLIESVTSHGPVDSKRHSELSDLFKDAKCGIVYVTAFPDRQTMSKYLPEISWETEVWVSEAPSHMIHFNGDRFLGPHE